MREEQDSPQFRAGFAALLGWTNVGKSTLLNRLVGTKIAAVADVSQTTRQRITGMRSIAGRGQVIFVDTPGLHRPRYKMNRAMVEATRQSLRDADLIVMVVDAERGIGAGDREAAGIAVAARAPRLLVLNKIDHVHPKSNLLPMMQEALDLGFPQAIPVSALTGEGCEPLLEEILGLLPLGPPLFPDDFLTDQPERVLAAEWIREKLLGLTRQELPHATAVAVERWQERDDGLLEIDATILVDRESQKRIVIGKQGALLKQVGSAARLELEAFLERRLFLRLWVRVRQDWRNDDALLRELGLG